jgi:hypothetical protein
MCGMPPAEKEQRKQDLLEGNKVGASELNLCARPCVHRVVLQEVLVDTDMTGSEGCTSHAVSDDARGAKSRHKAGVLTVRSPSSLR